MRIFEIGTWCSAIKRYLQFKFDKRVKFKPIKYTIGITVAPRIACEIEINTSFGYPLYVIEVDGYYEIDAMAIAFVLSENGKIIFYW